MYGNQRPNTFSGYMNFFNPNSTYGSDRYTASGQGSFQQAPLGDRYLEDNQDAAWTRQLAQSGYRDYTTKGEWARSQGSRMRNGYDAALATNPFLKFQDFARQNVGGLEETWKRMSADQRGERESMYNPRARQMSW